MSFEEDKVRLLALVYQPAIGRATEVSHVLTDCGNYGVHINLHQISITDLFEQTELLLKLGTIDPRRLRFGLNRNTLDVTFKSVGIPPEKMEAEIRAAFDAVKIEIGKYLARKQLAKDEVSAALEG